MKANQFIENYNVGKKLEAFLKEKFPEFSGVKVEATRHKSLFFVNFNHPIKKFLGLKYYPSFYFNNQKELELFKEICSYFENEGEEVEELKAKNWRLLNKLSITINLY